MPPAASSHNNASSDAFTELIKADGIDRVEKYLVLCRETSARPENEDWMVKIMPYLSVHSHSDSMPHPSLTFRFTVEQYHSNQMGNLHGGCAATIFDLCTTLPLHLIARPGFWMRLGVSRTLNCTYLRPIPVGSTINIYCEILQVGQKLSTIKGEIRALDDTGKLGALLAICEHGKANTDGAMVKL